MKKYILVDIDGTLTNFDKRRIKAAQDKDWDEFHRLCYLDTPNVEMINIIRTLSENYNICFITIRPESVKIKTEIFLEGAFGERIKAWTLLMRPDEMKIHDTALGKWQIFQHSSFMREQDIMLIIDDSLPTIEFFAQRGINGFYVGKRKRVNYDI